MGKTDYKYNEGLDTFLIPVEDFQIDEFVDSTFGKAYEQWLEDRFDITVKALIESNDQAEVNRLQGCLREIQTMQDFPDFLREENKLKSEDKAEEQKSNK